MNVRNIKDWLENFKLDSLKATLPNCWSAMGGVFGGRDGGASWLPLLFELFVALSLSVSYFFLVRTQMSSGDLINSYIFTAGSEKCYRLDQPVICDAWKGRLSGLLLSGALIDSSLNEHLVTPRLKERLNNVFGLYHTFWLLLLFLAVILALRHSLFINLGIFAGLIYNFSPAAGPYFYPWDMPATLFFTLAVLLFERRQMWLMVAATCVGCFFKETVLVCALLVLFARHWKWRKRMLTFAGIVAVYVLGKKVLLNLLHLDVAGLSMGNATNLAELLRHTFLNYNFKVLLSPTVNQVIFANAGTLVAVLVLGWRKRFLPYIALILVFLGGQLLYGGLNEFRIFMEVLPLSLILLSERWQEHAESDPADQLSAGPAAVWAVRKTFPVLIPMTIVLIGLSTGVAARQYYIIFGDLRQSKSELGTYTLETVEFSPELLQKAYADAELKLAMISAANQRLADSINHYERVLELDTNSVIALNNLAFLRVTAPDLGLRNGPEAVRLAERACQLTQQNDAESITTLALAYAEAGRFDDAVVTARKARAVALAQGQTEVAARNEQLLELYKSGRAFHQKAQTAP
jgi:tetratricopeptide (TPR) repeat protein